MKFVPVIITGVPTIPAAGVKEVMVGGPKLNPANVAVPFVVLIATLPLDPAPTVAVMFVDELTV